MDSFKKICVKLEKYISKSTSLKAISRGFSGIFPITIIGSLFTLISNIPIDMLRDLFVQINFDVWLKLPCLLTTGMIAVYAVFAIAYNYSNIVLNKNSMIVGATAVLCFLILVPIESVTVNNDLVQYIDFEYLSSKGLIVAILVSILVSKIYLFVIKQKINISLPNDVPEYVSNSFVALIPTIICVLFFLCMSIILSFSSYGNIHSFIYRIVQKPLSSLGNSLLAALIISGMTNILWWIGLHGSSIINPITAPVLYPLAIENLVAYQNGIDLPNIYTSKFMSVYNFGGAGMTISLCILFFLSRKKGNKILGKMSILPNLFNINEPIVYGVPIILNPIYFIPFVFAPMISTFLAYYFTYLGIIPKLVGYDIPWTMPPFLNGLIQGGWKVAMFQVFLLLINIVIYYPFFKFDESKNNN